MEPKRYIAVTYGTFREPYIIAPEGYTRIKLTDEQVDDPDAFEARILEIAAEHNITHIRDEEGAFWTLQEWTQHGV